MGRHPEDAACKGQAVAAMSCVAALLHRAGGTWIVLDLSPGEKVMLPVAAT